MTKRAAIAVALAALTGAAFAQEERPDRLIGGSVEELTATLGLSAPQRTSLEAAYKDLAKSYTELVKQIREQGLKSSQSELDKLREDARKKIGDLLQGPQKAAYTALVARKDALSHEYEKALFGLPPVTGIRMKLAMNEPDCAAMQRVADRAVDAIVKKMTTMTDAGKKTEEISVEVNTLRKKAVLDLIAAAPKGLDAKVRDAVRDYIKPVEQKLSTKEHDTLEKIMKGLDIRDAARAAELRRRVAAIMMHRAELAPLAQAKATEIVKLWLAGKKKEAEVWLRMDDYDTLIDIHKRRIEANQAELRATATTKEIARLASEKILD